MDLYATGHALSVWLLPVVLAITLHEAAHALTADRLGDDTARRLGRVSINPIRHIDPVGTLLVPGLLLLASPIVFGWAKPVPVAVQRLHHPKRDMALVAAAGPACNLVLAVLAAWLIVPAGWLGGNVEAWVVANLANAILINLVLAIFNLFPLPPLDGGRILVGLLPMPFALYVARLERWGFPILLALLFVVPLVTRELGVGFSPIGAFVIGALQPALALVAALSPWSTQQLWGALL